MCSYLLDVRIPKKVANILKKIISDKNTPEIVQNFYDHQVLLGYKNSRTMCFLHDTAVNNSHTLRTDQPNKHLYNRSCKAKVPIDLERWVCTQHIGINAASHTGNIFLPGITELVFQKPLCMFPIPESGPEACFPCHTPSGSFVPAPFQSHPAGFQKLRGVFCDQVSGIKAIQMGYMAVMDLCFRIIQEPFPDLSKASRLKWRQFCRIPFPAS